MQAYFWENFPRKSPFFLCSRKDSVSSPNTYLLEHCADCVVYPDDVAGPQGRVLPKQEIGRKDADQCEVLLTAQPHDSQGCFDAHGELLVVGSLHLGDL